MAFIHKDLAAGKWQKLSLAEQLGNIGSEVLRASRDKDDGSTKLTIKNEQLLSGPVERALELFDLTLNDHRWKGRYREIARAREVFCDAVYGGKLYGSSLQALVPYFDNFAFAARKSC